MKKLLFLLLFGSCSLLTVHAQNTFQRTIGGTSYDYGFSVIQTTDGGFAAAGYTNSFGAGGVDLYVVKLDGSGTLQWSKTTGGTGTEFEYSIIQTSDGGFAVAGYTSSFGAGGVDMYIVKLNSSGTMLWSKTIGGTGYDVVSCIIQTTDGGYALAGPTDSFGSGLDMYIVKLDSSGTLQWSKTIGGSGSDGANWIVQTTDGGYAAAGYTNSFAPPYYDMYIVKLNSSGTLLWSKTAGGTLNEYATSITQTTDGGFAVAGYTNSFVPNSDMYIVKLDPGGALQWNRTIGGTDQDYGSSIIQTTDGGYIVAGSTQSFGAGAYDVYIVKLAVSGTLLWNKTFGGTGNDYGNSIKQTTDGGYAVAGSSQTFGAGSFDIYIARLDASGNICGNSSSPPSTTGTGGTLGNQTSTITTPTPTVTSPASSASTGGTFTSICSFVGIQPVSNELPETYQLYQNYPNPFNPTTNLRFEISDMRFINLKIYNALGGEVNTLINEQLMPGIYEVSWDATNYPSGVYYYQLNAGDFAVAKKMVLVK